VSGSALLGVSGGPDANGEFRMTAQENKLLELTNAERAKKDLPPLTANPLLFKIARAHSANMAKQSKMEHILDGKNPFQRVLEAGYDYQYTGENIADLHKSFSLEVLLKEWMNSEHHRENILNKNFTEIGLGIAAGKKDSVYYTQVFGKPLPPPKKGEP
jgi:uncharacterized protein YkwD